MLAVRLKHGTGSLIRRANPSIIEHPTRSSVIRRSSMATGVSTRGGTSEQRRGWTLHLTRRQWRWSSGMRWRDRAFGRHSSPVAQSDAASWSAQPHLALERPAHASLQCDAGSG